MSDNKLKGTPLLKEALSDAEKLLSYASEYGIELELKHIKALVNAKKNNQINEWTEDEEINFWIAFQALSKAVLPVTIDSIRAASIPSEIKKENWWSKIFKSKNKSLVEHSVTFYRRIAIVAMIGMLAIQIYAIIGTALMSKYTKGNVRMKEIELRLHSLDLITSANLEDKTARKEQQNLEMEQDELAQEAESGIHLMNDWLNFTYNVWSSASDSISKRLSLSHTFSDGPPTEVGSHTSENVVVLQQSKSLIIILNQYILPLLYGLLGGIAFVLRSIASETKSMTYTPTSRIKYGLRIHLGALAGLVIGFLWSDLQGKSFGVVESLSPLAVAFLAGYSVDFLFRLLDSMIGTTGKKAAQVTGDDSAKKE